MAKIAPTRRTSATQSARRGTQNATDTTQHAGIAGPNPRLRTGRTSITGATSRTQSVGRPGATSDPERARGERRLPAANATPRAAATSSRRTPRSLLSDGDRKRLESAQILVVATQMGYYDDLRRRAGDVFYIHAEEDFSDLWMEDAPKGAEPSITLGQDDIDRQHDEILASRAGSRGRRVAGGVAGNVNTEEDRTLSQVQRRQQGMQVGRDDVNQEEIPQGIDNPLGAED